MAEDAKGEYRGLAYRNDAELQAWLARRPKEAALDQMAEVTFAGDSPVEGSGFEPRSKRCEPVHIQNQV